MERASLDRIVLYNDLMQKENGLRSSEPIKNTRWHCVFKISRTCLHLDLSLLVWSVHYVQLGLKATRQRETTSRQVSTLYAAWVADQ